ncbi:hypothetical protein LTR08_003704 [Meristemomyces frigidus]|nr:hypothetical protein LTR08_003704 [Meristemomyces frigidus]
MSVSSYEGPRAFTITPDDHGGIVVVVSTLLMTWMVLCYTIRVFNRLAYSASLGVDDLIAGLATKVIGVVQTLVACVSVSHGFGKATALVTEIQYQLAIDLLSLLAIAVSKAAMLAFHLRITPQRNTRLACYILTGAAGWTGIALSNGILELAIFAMPIWIVWDLQTSFAYKAMIVMTFASRLFVIVASAVHASTSASWAAASFPAVDAVTPAVWLQLQTHYAIMSATFPTLGTFMKSLNTRWGALNGLDLAQYGMDSLSQTRKTDTSGTLSRHTRSDTRSALKLRPDSSTEYTFQVRAPQHPSRSRERLSDASDQMIIRKTVSTVIESH